MDPLTQGVVAAVASQQCSKSQLLGAATVLGFLSGMAPDLDIFIRSSSDPLLALEYHRHFTHSLLFIPFGGFICALFFFYVFAKRAGLSFGQTYVYCTVGYATHGLLDACTSYGTQLLWPFSSMRVAWNTVSIIDPLLTLPLLALIVLSVVRRDRRYAVCALVWLTVYTVLGIVQRERAESFGLTIAQQRGHSPLELSAKPSFANLLLWKVVYTTEDSFYVDAVRTGFRFTHFQGSRIDRLDVARDFPWLNADSQQAKDVERFRWFSNGYIAVSPRYPNRIIDIRYSLIPNEIKGMWGIELDKSRQHDEHVNYVTDPQRDRHVFDTLWGMIVNQ